MSQYKKIYFMGIKGVGMATLAVMAKQAGFTVAGSDTEEEFITDKILKDAGIDLLIGFKKENPQKFFDVSPKSECLFIATAAHDGFENVEAKWARFNGIKVISHAAAVGMFMAGELFAKKLEGISVAGAHGKTTIAGMISACLMGLKFDPSYTVGTSEIFSIGPAGHFGSGKYFVAEADEYLSEMNYDRTPKFLYQRPKYLIINNIDYDHPDMYSDLEEVVMAYKQFVRNLRNGGHLIVNGDDRNLKNFKFQIPNLNFITYGADEENDFVIKNFKEKGFGSQFEVLRSGTSLGNFQLSIPGYHNAKNSLSVIALLIEIGASVGDIQRVLPEFRGVKRRLEKIGETETGVLIFDDYAHHPEEIKKSIEALKSAYADKKITLVFQAHTYSRTKAFLSEFASSFTQVSELIIIPTFASARDSKKHDIDEDQALLEKIRVVQSNVKLIETQAHVVEYLEKNVRGQDKIIMTMGAGDVYKIAYRLIK